MAYTGPAAVDLSPMPIRAIWGGDGIRSLVSASMSRWKPPTVPGLIFSSHPLCTLTPQYGCVKQRRNAETPHTASPLSCLVIR
eukprot:1888691-Prymnesium_polylepis.1